MYTILEAEGLNEAHREEGFLSIQQAVHILGGKWSFLVLARLYCRPHRFNQLRKQLDEISTKSLTDTLRHLERNTMIQRTFFPLFPSHFSLEKSYAATLWEWSSRGCARCKRVTASARL